MNTTPPTNETRVLTWGKSLAWSAAAIASFHLAYASSKLSFLIIVFLFSLFQLRYLNSSRKAFYFGLVIGFSIYAPQLSFFWKIFGVAAIALWLVLSFWIGVFLLLSQLATRRLGEMKSALLIPFLWLGLEYFRSELYYLRFSWINVGFVFDTHIASLLGVLGVYGIGFLCAAIAIAADNKNRKRSGAVFATSCLPLFLLANAPDDFIPYSKLDRKVPKIAGIQLEFPSERDVLSGLDQLVEDFPEAELLVLSEYTFTDRLPERVKDWCKRNQRHLVVGAHDPLVDGNYYNTAFVIAPSGEVVFKQAKSVPIQFFKDGLPAKKQALWHSPWGKIGVCICYDLSYRRVVDELVRQGAEALIIPTMDMLEWGEYQHKLHARVAPVRSAEYGIPLFRVCSSGISQFTDSNGYVRASAAFPGQEQTLSGPLSFTKPGRLPLDHWLAPFAVVVTVLFVLWLCLDRLKKPKALS